MDAPLRLALFGSPTVEQGGRSQALPLERRGQLVALLALERRWVPRSDVAALLWPEQAAKLAHANLRKTLFRLQGPPWAQAVQTEGEALRGVAASDVQDFEQALADGRPAAALALYRGELLAGFDDGASEPWTRWLAEARERLRGAWRGAALRVLETGGLAPADAAALAARLLEADPLDEAALAAQMRALDAGGQAAAAQAAYRRFAARLQEELGIEPSAELRAAQAGSAAAAAEASVAKAAMATAGDAGFVGRAVELQRVVALLARAECRLLVLVGPGGVGKTRLARRAHAELAASQPDGALFVALDDAVTPAQFAGRMAQALALPRGRGDALRAVTEALRARRLLLVLDNFEPLAEHAADLLEPLLDAAPGLKLLVTSRVRLAVAGDWSMPLEGLPCPDREDEDRAEAFDAVKLFVQAAQRVEPGFAATPAETAAIVDICRLVEGLPLALELAAAWVRVLPCAAIAAELRRGTELLRSAEASARRGRHASIEQVFEQSWSRLAPAERAALARLAVFRGGAGVEAARAVAGAPLPVLAALTDKSLLRKDGARMHLHPLVQQLAAAQLDAEALATTRMAHAAWFLGWLARLQAGAEDGERAALQAIEAEFDNCRAAWQAGTSCGAAALLTASARTLLNYCDYRGRAEEALALLRATLAAPVAQDDPALRALLLAQAAHCEYRLNRHAEAEASALQALDLAGPQGDAAARVQAATVLASSALQLGRYDDARRHYQAALALAPAGGALRHRRAATLDNLALVEKRQGRYDAALKLALESLALHRSLGDQAGVALCLNNLANLYSAMRQYEAAAAQLREGMAIAERDGNLSTLGYLLANLADACARAGDAAAAERHARRGFEVATGVGNRSLAAWLQSQLAGLLARRGALAEARAALAAAALAAFELRQPTIWAVALMGFVHLLDAQGERGCARQLLAFLIAHPDTSAPDRDELRGELAERAAPGDDAPWPDGLAIDELLQRVAAEAGVAHAPLRARLRGAA